MQLRYNGQKASIVYSRKKWESFALAIRKSSAAVIERDGMGGGGVQTGHSVTSLPLRVWQLRTSLLWQPDECSEWVVTLATATLSWPYLYILPDSPRWRWAHHMHTVDNAHTHTHTFANTHTCHTRTSLFFSLYLWGNSTETQTLGGTMLMPTRLCSFGHNYVVQRGVPSPMG